MKKMFLLIAAIAMIANVQAQKIYTKAGNVSFDATADLEKIAAVNKKATCIVNTATGGMELAILMKAFEFPKALMEEHFNENYVESDTYPKATFKGTITNLSDINFAADGTYPATITGDMTMHGVTKNMTAKGTFTVKDKVVSGTSTFKILLSDYNISIPSVVEKSISKEATITVNVVLDQVAQ